ncbi:PhnD/SsuA/transferrin family substrate-binding protein [Thiomicrorhabdus sp. 6S2-11]|uniref:PhnD/SsuA/transferrin family substrate-binding protein n=1 Tax=Thiomicrorhabdus marina TaxID=2818442 RepID=A0ABS3Q4J2_9GAMM|nr:PhnD/SsuA/transferrin family substrate-binding protein [Thiomicrorhabdus marina]MBO1927260.1 PhnD/SsuA/transferrin family substrate-binding protein [Thiomicrorhabdus marina]
MKQFLIFLLFSSTVYLSACDISESEQITSKSATPSEPPFVLTVLPYDVPTKLQQHFTPLLTYLSRELQRPVTLYVASSYEDQILKIAQNKVDLAYLGPSSFVRTYDRFADENGLKIQPIATEAPYEGAVVVHKDSQITQIKELKNHTFAFGAYQSYAGHFKIREELKKQNVSLFDLKLYRFMGRHERAVMSVAYGEFDAAASSAGIARRVENLNYPIKTIFTTEELPPIVIAASPKMDAATVQHLKQMLLNPDFEGQEAITLFAPEGTFYPFNNRLYDPVREVIKELEQ